MAPQRQRRRAQRRHRGGMSSAGIAQPCVHTIPACICVQRHVMAGCGMVRQGRAGRQQPS